MPAQDIVLKSINNFVVPLGTIKEKEYVDDDGRKTEAVFESFGTGFFIGSKGTLMTAAHVIDQMIASGGSLVLLISISDRWHYFEILSYEKHPIEDVAIVRTKEKAFYSIMQLASTTENATCDYMLWGYPQHVSEELSAITGQSSSGSGIEKPEIIVNKGYIKRRISREFPYQYFLGQSFYELSEIAGAKCSGSPVIKVVNNLWQVIGIYIGEHTGSWQFAAGYAVKTDSLIDWHPSILGNSVFEEKATYA